MTMAPEACECNLAGQIAIVTGGAHGIGRAIAQGFQKTGAQVCILDCDQGVGVALTRSSA